MQETINKLVHEFSSVMSKEEMLDKYKWFDKASGIHNEQTTLALLQNAVGVNACKRYDNLKRLQSNLTDY